MDEAARKSVVPAPTCPALPQLHPAMPGQQGQMLQQLSADGQEAPDTEANRCWERQSRLLPGHLQGAIDSAAGKVLPPAAQNAYLSGPSAAPPQVRSPLGLCSPPTPTGFASRLSESPVSRPPLTQHWLVQTKTR